MKKYNICIVSGCDEKQQVFGDIAAELMKKYSAKHNYDFKYYTKDKFYFVPGLGIDSLEQQDPTKQFKQTRVPNWNKVSIVASNIDKYDFVLWVDSDIFFLKDDKRLEELFELDRFYDKEFFLCPDAESLNVGFFLIKNSPNMKLLLRQWIQMGIDKNEYFSKGFASGQSICFYEQAAFSELYFKNWNNLMHQTQIMSSKKLNAHLQNQFWRGPYLDYLQANKDSYILHLAGLSFKHRVEVSKLIKENHFEVDTYEP